MRLPPWMWGSNAQDFFDQAELQGTRSGDDWRVQTIERYRGKKPDLVRVLDVAGPGVAVDGFTLLRELEQGSLAIDHNHDGLDDEIARLTHRAEHDSLIGDPTSSFALMQLLLSIAPRAEAPMRAKWCVDQLRAMTLVERPSERVFSGTGLQLISARPALRSRLKVPSVLLRLTQDTKLDSGDISHIQAAHQSGEEIFASSTKLYEGSVVLDAYVGPLLGALTPWVWAFSTVRSSGVYVFTLGCGLAGTRGGAAELLQVLPQRGTDRASGPVALSAKASTSAVRWWTRRVNTLFGVLSDPAAFVDGNDAYSPSRHLQATLNIEQLFRRVSSIQTAHRDSNARLVLFFTVLDTLADSLITSRTIAEMCTARVARTTLTALRRDLPLEVAEVLLPNAERGVRALEELQSGFFLVRQLATPGVTLLLGNGQASTITREVAAADYIKVLRDATHGHGYRDLDTERRADALLTHHNGDTPHDLPLLAYLYLLYLLANPHVLRQSIKDGKR